MKTKEKLGIRGFISKITSYIIFPLFAIGILAIIITSFSNPAGSMPQFLGISVVRIESGSMVEKGFAIGDVVLMNQNYEKPLKVGDIIGFYNIEDSFDKGKYNISNQIENSSLVPFESFDGGFAESFSYAGRITPEKLQSQNYKITFHEIVNVYVSPDGIVFYETKGSNPNVSSDGFIRQDFVVAKYIFTPNILKSVMSFIITPIGMVLLVFAPLSLIVGFEGYNVMKKIYAYNLESKLLKGEVLFDDERVKNYKVKDIMSDSKKAYFWLISDKKDKPEVFEFLFKVEDTKDKNQIQLYQNAQKARQVFEKKGPLEYFRFWHLTLDGYFDRKDIINYKKQYEEKIINLNKNKE